MPHNPIPPAHRAPALCALLFFAFGLLAALSVPARGAEPGPRAGLFLHAPGSPATRFPFDAITPGGPLRYMVTAVE